MRLWHEKLIPYLNNQRILGQHRECAALRGLGWQRKHSTVDYIFQYSPYRLVRYHRLIIREMVKRGFKPDLIWDNCHHRGKNCDPWIEMINDDDYPNYPIYKEHNEGYLVECLDNLRRKGVELEVI